VPANPPDDGTVTSKEDDIVEGGSEPAYLLYQDYHLEDVDRHQAETGNGQDLAGQEQADEKLSSKKDLGHHDGHESVNHHGEGERRQKSADPLDTPTGSQQVSDAESGSQGHHSIAQNPQDNNEELNASWNEGDSIWNSSKANGSKDLLSCTNQMPCLA
jgi:hypothetical protein